MSERAIIYIDDISACNPSDEPPVWEIHVRRTDGNIDVFTTVKCEDGWLLHHVQGDVCTCGSLGDAFMQALDPIAPGDT